MYKYQKAVWQREVSLLLHTCYVTWPFQIAVACVNATNSSWIYQSCGMLHWVSVEWKQKKGDNSCSRTSSSHSFSEKDNDFVRGQTAFFIASWSSSFFPSHLFLNYTHSSEQSATGHLYIRLLNWHILPSFAVLKSWSHSEGLFEAGSVGVEPSAVPPVLTTCSGGEIAFRSDVRSNKKEGETDLILSLIRVLSCHEKPSARSLYNRAALSVVVHY